MSGDVPVALTLGAVSSVSVAALFPYLLVVAPKLRKLARPLSQLVLTRSLNAGITVFVLAWIGLRLGAPLGLDAPLLRAWLAGGTTAAGVRTLPLAVVVGVGVGALILVLERLFFLRSLPAATVQRAAPPARWKGLLASFYGGIVEEVLSRLFLMSAVAWIGATLLHPPASLLFPVAALVAALVFAAGHLPVAGQLGPLTRPVVIRVIALNTLAGYAFGILFWHYGLEHAMVAHFSTDLVLQVVTGGGANQLGRRN